MWRSMPRNWIYSRAVVVIGKRSLRAESAKAAKSKLFVLQSLRLLINKHKSEIRMPLRTLIVRQMLSVFCIDIISSYSVHRRCHARLYALAEKIFFVKLKQLGQKVSRSWCFSFLLKFTSAWNFCVSKHQSHYSALYVVLIVDPNSN